MGARASHTIGENSAFQLQSIGLAQEPSNNAAQQHDFPHPAPVFQLQESLAEKIWRILDKRGIQISQQDAETYAQALAANAANTLVPVVGHHRALKRNVNGSISSVRWLPPRDASRMRVDPSLGPVTESASNMLTNGQRPLTGARVSQDITIDSRTLGNVGPRASLRGVMGASAAAESGIVNSEWLHIIAHSLGGPDDAANIIAGSHALNTAMIPFERRVRAMVSTGEVVDYSVTFFCDPMSELPNAPLSDRLYVHHVEIRMTLWNGSSQIWTLEANLQNLAAYINGGVLNDLQQAADSF